MLCPKVIIIHFLRMVLWKRHFRCLQPLVFVSFLLCPKVIIIHFLHHKCLSSTVRDLDTKCITNLYLLSTWVAIYSYPSYVSDLPIHKSWYSLDELKPISLRKSPKKFWNELDAVFKPYTARFRTTIAPNFAPNYWPHVDQIFSTHGAMKKAFQMSPANILCQFFTVSKGYYS